MKLEKNCKYILHEFVLGDVEDPEIYCADPIIKWQETDYGKWCMKVAEDITYNITPNPHIYGYKVTLIGNVSGKHATFLALKRA